MTHSIFIDGAEGTTGLNILDRLEGRPELDLIRLANDKRKDPKARREALNDASVAILCLPDDASRTAVSMIDNKTTRVIDASTAHRISKEWTYGFPEMTSEQADKISGAARVTNPGCYPTGAIALVRPIVETGIVPVDFPVTINAVSGYSGGGKSLIARMENPDAKNSIDSAWFGYGLGLAHKHTPEIQKYSALKHPPVFSPSVARFRQGMIVQVPLQLWSLPALQSTADITEIMQAWYQGCSFVSVVDKAETTDRIAFLDAEELNDTNELRIFVFSNEETKQVILAAQLDNLGKGASGQAVQCLNLMLGLEEKAGLD
ncbi:MAG: N-acetyl-gamma-glutamyl-phosphate reductase [Alphaproteobacteria bacterium MarineAlpha11_Bin1]|nr:MAG: N-acetyl-gamma-glutamyl-phosphate reductase [Alphaproteobacteria bacterium MarineAlpha11_Bin1]|tara:strand:- start:17028 stop:17981 length:954 start_codon:yes stop_codon:yes gene_type:complete